MIRKYIVVENAGMRDERDVAEFSDYLTATSYMDKHYNAEERNRDHPDCLFPDVCVEINGERSYEI